MIDLRHAFRFSREPFPQDVALDQLFGRPGLDALLDRFHYTIELAMVGVITGQVGSGKSTSLRCAASRLHPSAFRLLAVLASAGTYMELLRGIAAAAGLQHRVTSTVTLTTTIRDHLTDIRAKKQTPLLIIDEAHLMRLDVFAQLAHPHPVPVRFSEPQAGRALWPGRVDRQAPVSHLAAIRFACGRPFPLGAAAAQPDV